MNNLINVKANGEEKFGMSIYTDINNKNFFEEEGWFYTISDNGGILKHRNPVSNNFIFFDGNNYRLKTNYEYIFIIEDREELLTDEIVLKLKEYKDTIYHNDLESYYWIFDFTINDIWFESLKVDPCQHTIILKAFK